MFNEKQIFENLKEIYEISVEKDLFLKNLVENVLKFVYSHSQAICAGLIDLLIDLKLTST